MMTDVFDFVVVISMNNLLNSLSKFEISGTTHKYYAKIVKLNTISNGRLWLICVYCTRTAVYREDEVLMGCSVQMCPAHWA